MMPAARSAVGVDLGGSKIAAGVVHPDGTIGNRRRIALPSAPRLVDELVDVIADLVSPDTAAVGVGMAGMVRWSKGEFVWGPHSPITNVPVRDILEERFSLPAVVDNDANAAGFGETLLGAGRGFSHVLYVALGSGIGGALIVDGSVYRGRAFAGEIGHMTIDANGPLCACGHRGCWETYVSGPVLDDEARRLGLGDSGADLSAAGFAGDRRAIETLQRVGRSLGDGLSNLIAILDPDLVVMGGAAAVAGDLLLDPARAAIASRLEGAEWRQPVQLVPALFGPEATMVGAALLALQAEVGLKVASG